MVQSVILRKVIRAHQQKAKSLCCLVFFCAVLAGCATPPEVTTEALPKDIAIILSGNVPAFTGVSREIQKRYKNPVEIFNLDNREDVSSQMLHKIQASASPVVVAIGLPAARLARRLSGKKVIFCQVFNYEEQEFTSPSMKGVSAVAPVREQFRTWKMLSPGLKKIGVITGKNLRGLLDEAHAAASENHLELIHVEVRSDKEMLYAFKQLSPKVQGLWLVPDNRVLSHNAIRDMMGYSVKEGMQVLVFSRELLGLGGLMSHESSYADVAEQVLAKVSQTQKSGGNLGENISPLTKSTIRINAVMANRLGLKIPDAFAGFVYAL